MTADGDDHISPDKLNCLSKSSESQYNPSFLGSHVVLQPRATELVIGRGGQSSKPQILREYLTDAKKSFPSPMDRQTKLLSQSLKHILLPIGPTWRLHLPCFPLVFTMIMSTDSSQSARTFHRQAVSNLQFLTGNRVSGFLKMKNLSMCEHIMLMSSI